VSTPVCANCGLPLSRQVYRSANGTAYCCRGCAERILCQCRLAVLHSGRITSVVAPADQGVLSSGRFLSDESNDIRRV
jgi:hypothetical protein